MNTNFDLTVRCQDCGTPVSPDLDCPECDAKELAEMAEVCYNCGSDLNEHCPCNGFDEIEDSFIDATWEEA